jgi:DNA-binding MarR family transcriptional regulator
MLIELSNMTIRIDRDMQHQFGFSLGEYRIMAALEHGPVRQNQLCGGTLSSAAAVSRWLKQLAREGCVTRQRPPQDRRTLHARITRRGLNQLRRIRPWLTEVLRPMTDELVPESEYLLIQLHNNLEGILRRFPDSTA